MIRNKDSDSYSNKINCKNLILKIIILCFIFSFYKPLYNLKANENIYYSNDSYSEIIEIQKRKMSIYNRVNLIDGKLYWNNETSLEIDKINEEIKNFTTKLSFKNKADFEKRKYPKISLVITLYNQEKNIKSIYASIQKQELKDIEIIFIDDNSEDNTHMIIKKLMKKDKRIIYIKNFINKRAFYSRNKGILKAKGEYILCVDPDDILVNNILLKAFEAAKKYDLDIVHYYALKGYYESPKLWGELKYKSGILKSNDEIRDNFYHSISRCLWDKLVKRNIFRKSVKFMKKEFYHELYYINNDNTAFFGLLHTAQTYGFLEQIGYFYITRPNGSYYYRKDPKNMNLIFRSIFNNMKYFYMQSNNNTFDKSYLAFEYFNKSMRLFGKYLPYLNDGLDYILDIIRLYLNSSYFNHTQKKKMKLFELEFIERRKETINDSKNKLL